MDVRWRRDRRSPTAHAYPVADIGGVALCGLPVRAPFQNEYPAPPATFERVRHCLRCRSAMRRDA